MTKEQAKKEVNRLWDLLIVNKNKKGSYEEFKKILDRICEIEKQHAI